MPTMDIDKEVARIFEPIIVIIDETEYVITKIESGVLEAIIDSRDKPAGMRTNFEQLVGAAKNTFKSSDFKKLTLAMRFITTSVMEQLNEFQSKNVPGESVTKTP